MTLDKARRILGSFASGRFDEPIAPEDIQALAQAYIDLTAANQMLEKIINLEQEAHIATCERALEYARGVASERDQLARMIARVEKAAGL